MALRNGTYLRLDLSEITAIYYSPYSFGHGDPVKSFHKRDMYDDGWERVYDVEEQELSKVVELGPGECVFIRGGKKVEV